MKKIIAGRLYDTETATKIADYHSSYPYNDFGYYEESLYRKKTGEFFLYGEGGPASKYAKSVGQNEWRGSEKIIPISYENAQKWAEEKLDADEYEKIFGPVEENEAKKAVTLYLQTDILEKAKRAAQKNDMTISAFFEMAVNEMVEKC